MHSAEWYRGAVAALDDCLANGFYKQKHDHYRRLLAKAEAREAGEREAAGVGDLFNDISYSEGGGYDQGDVTEALYKAYELGANSLAEQLAAAQAEVVKLAELVKEYLDPEEWKHENRAGWILCSGCGSQLDIGMYHAPDCKWVTRVKQAESPALAWLADRDARMKALGAAEWLRGYLTGLFNMQPEEYKGAALKPLTDELTRLEAEAARLAEVE